MKRTGGRRGCFSFLAELARENIFVDTFVQVRPKELSTNSLVSFEKSQMSSSWVVVKQFQHPAMEAVGDNQQKPVSFRRVISLVEHAILQYKVLTSADEFVVTGRN